MSKYLELRDILKALLGSDNVYFQPPGNTVMKYPCIVFERDRLEATHADDKPYTLQDRYSVIVIDPNPDSGVIERMRHLPLCSFDRHYTANNLNHDVFNVYF